MPTYGLYSVVLASLRLGKLTFDEGPVTMQEPKKRLRVAESWLWLSAQGGQSLTYFLLQLSSEENAQAPGTAYEKPRGNPLPSTHLPSTTGPILWRSSQLYLRTGKPNILRGNSLHNSQPNHSSEFHQLSKWTP